VLFNILELFSGKKELKKRLGVWLPLKVVEFQNIFLINFFKNLSDIKKKTWFVGEFKTSNISGQRCA